MVRLTDCLEMTIAVDWDQITNQNNPFPAICGLLSHLLTVNSEIFSRVLFS